MEAFSLLKYWRTSHAATPGATGNNSGNVVAESEEDSNADDGPFFDMEFTVDGDDRAVKKANITESDEECDECDCAREDEDEDEDEFEEDVKFTLSSGSSGESIDPNISLSPSDDLFFKGRLVPLTEAHTYTDEADTNTNKPVTKSQKLRVLMLKLKKSTKLSVVKVKGSENLHEKQSAKFFTVKFKVEEVPVISKFTRENSSKVASTKAAKENAEKSKVIEEEERVFSKDMVNKYLKKVKLGFSGHLTGSGAARMSEISQAESGKPRIKQGISFPGKLRVVRNQLGKSKSASSTVTAAADSPPAVMLAKRRDDSLLQQQDGIQSAIMHCKRSFKASRELEGKENANVPTAELSCSADKAKGDKH